MCQSAAEDPHPDRILQSQNELFAWQIHAHAPIPAVIGAWLPLICFWRRINLNVVKHGSTYAWLHQLMCNESISMMLNHGSAVKQQPTASKRARLRGGA